MRRWEVALPPAQTLDRSACDCFAFRGNVSGRGRDRFDGRGSVGHGAGAEFQGFGVSIVWFVSTEKRWGLDHR